MQPKEPSYKITKLLKYLVILKRDSKFRDCFGVDKYKELENHGNNRLVNFSEQHREGMKIYWFNGKHRDRHRR